MLVTLALLTSLVQSQPPSAAAFEIDIDATFLPNGLIAHNHPTGIHEEITEEVITLAKPDADADLILGIQRGVENTDITHQFDSESHFDNASVPLDCNLGFNSGTDPARPCNQGFEEGFAIIEQRYQAALKLAKRNPRFFRPGFKTFKDIGENMSQTFRDLVFDRKCVTRSACPTSTFAKYRVELKEAFLPILSLDPNPDPHMSTNPKSIFRGQGPPPIGGIVKRMATLYRDMIVAIDDMAREALGKHKGKTLTQVLGSDHPEVKSLKNLRLDIRAYKAFQLLGHAFHTTEDFFAHSNYVELMAGVEVGQPIGGVDIPVPPDWSQFSLAGLRSVMGETRFARLQTGEVLTYWLGEGDACGGANFFNPMDLSRKVKAFSVLTLSIPGFIIGSNMAGSNRGTSDGFEFCHYDTRTAEGEGAPGLNKDHGCTETCAEPQLINHGKAREAATDVALLLWEAFLADLKKDDASCNLAAATLTGTDGDDILNGTPEDDVIFGGEGDDDINGFAGNDTLCGGDGYDKLDGSDGNDILVGGSEDDTLVGWLGSDVVDGGPNEEVKGLRSRGDVIDYSDSPCDVYVDLEKEQGAEVGGREDACITTGTNPEFPHNSQDNDTLIDIESISGPGKPGLQVFGELRGDSDVNVIVGGRLFDTIEGRAGDDFLYGSRGLEDGKGDLNDHDYLKGDEGDDYLDGGGGGDSIVPGPGKDTINDTGAPPGNQPLRSDAIAYTDHPASITFDLRDGVFTSSAGGTDTYTGIEGVLGTKFADVLTGTDGADLLAGDDGNDSLIGLLGNDDLRGGAGDDHLEGNGGDDYLDGYFGNDTLYGGDGDDNAFGDEGEDFCEAEFHIACEQFARLPMWRPA